MASIGKIARRSFLVGSVALAGGVAFGVWRVRTPYANPNLAQLGPDEASFNAWVKISPDQITLITPHADKGQGVASAQAALIAEEMDLDFGQFEIDFGVPDKAYWNTAMAEEAVPFASTDKSFSAETMRSMMGGMMKLIGLQGTGGSTAMTDSFVKLRTAGAVARETLKAAAAEMHGVAAGDLKTASGKVILPDGTEVPYTDLSSAAAAMDPVTDVTLRDPSEWRLIGKPMQRLDIVGKSTGTLPYGIDVSVDGMKFATVKTSPRRGALNGYDASEAEKMRGVKAIVPVTGGVGVVADNTWRAFQAAEAIQFDWGPSAYPAEQADHWAALEASFGEDTLDKEWRHDGDVPATLDASAQVIEAEYRSPYVAHAPLEPLNAVVRVDDDKVEVWTGHQMPIMLQQQVAAITGHDADQVIFHNQFIGGSFGHRLEFEHVKQAAEIAAQMKGVPIKMTYSREEDMIHDFPRHISIGRGKGTVQDGKVVAMDLNIAAPSVINSQMGRAGLSVPGPDPQIVAGAWNNPYKLEGLRMCGFRAPELAPTSSWRAVGAPAAGFYFDSFLDELIHAAGADPMAERIRLMEHPVARKVLETVAEMSSWGGELAPGKGRGVAFVESFGVPVAEVVEVTNTDRGIKIDKVWVAADVGRVIDPMNFENLVQGGVVYGLGHAMNCEITYADGMAEQDNYHVHEGMRLYQCPEIVVQGLENQEMVRGIGEPPVPPAAPALANAIFAATGTRVREMPFNKTVDFV